MARRTTVHHHMRHTDSGIVPVVQHTRHLDDRPELPKYEKPDWAKNNSYNDWEGQIYDEISRKLDITYSDAQSIVDAQPFLMQQSWGKGLTIKETVDKIEKASRHENTQPQTELESKDFSESQNKGFSKFASGSLSDVRAWQKKYQDETGKNPNNILNKGDFYDFVNKNELKKQTELDKINENLGRNTGGGFDENQYRDRLTGVISTSGVKQLEEEAKCGWLISDASVIVKSAKLKNEDFISINIESKDNKAVVTYDDGNGNILYKQQYRYTDFPEGKLKLFYTNGTMMLPNEY